MAWDNPPINFSVQVLKDADTLTKKITGEMLQKVILATPVDTGQARQNWRVSVGKVDKSTEYGSFDRSGNGAIQQGLATIAAGGGIGKIVYISNSLKYIERLNDGWSMQAPKNFMQIAFKSIVDKYR